MRCADWDRHMPTARLRAFVVLGDEPPQLAREVGHGGEDAAGEEIAFHLGEPELDLVEPRGDWRGLLTKHVEDGRELLRQVLSGPLRLWAVEGERRVFRF